MASTRRLAGILALDVAGYSRLMGADEEGTHERLKTHLGQLVDPRIKEHRGRIVKNTGDGLLAEFPSVVDAVRCATEVQRSMVDREPEVPEARRIKFRIGINLGDVIVEEHDIFGDGVNVAARLEALAEPGGICVSRMVRDQIRDKLPYRFEDRGEQSFKNIARPVRVYGLRPEAVADLPEHVLVCDLDVFQRDRGGVGRVQPHLVLDRLGFEPGLVGVDQEASQPAMGQLGIGLGEAFAGFARLPHTEEPEPVKAERGEAIEFAIRDFGERETMGGVAGEFPEPEAGVTLI